MHIVMTVSMPGSPDGARVLQYPEGETFAVGSPNMPQELADIFLGEGWAKEANPDENKALNPELEYKDLKVDQLKVLAEAAGIEGFDKMLKADLIAVLDKKLAESAPSA